MIATSFFLFTTILIVMRTLFIAVALLGFSSGVSACDVCGCSIGGNYFGILPQFTRHFVGLRWTMERTRTAVSAQALREGRLHSEEMFRSADLVARFYPAHRWQVLLLAPYRIQEQREATRLVQVQGLGDVSLLANFILLDTGDSLKRRWRHTLTVGSGVKLPTGRSSQVAADGVQLHPNVQLGSGSTDILFAAAYTLRQGAWGWSADLLARWNTANKQAYHFGNRLSGSTKFFLWKNLRGVTLLPNAGIFADAAQANRDQNTLVRGSEGISVFSTFGLDAYTGRFSAGFSYQPPLWQNRSTVAFGARWVVSANIIF